MANYNGYENVEKLAEAYGYDMMLHGKSMYWSSPRECPDTTPDLQRCGLYSKLSSVEQSQMLEYGHEMKRFGMGCYQERGACADLYDRYVFRGGIPNPFAGKGSGSSQPNGPEM